MQIFEASISRKIESEKIEDTCFSDSDLKQLADWINQNSKESQGRSTLEFISIIETVSGVEVETLKAKITIQ